MPFIHAVAFAVVGAQCKRSLRPCARCLCRCHCAVMEGPRRRADVPFTERMRSILHRGRPTPSPHILTVVGAQCKRSLRPCARCPCRMPSPYCRSLSRALLFRNSRAPGSFRRKLHAQAQLAPAVRAVRRRRIAVPCRASSSSATHAPGSFRRKLQAQAQLAPHYLKRGNTRAPRTERQTSGGTCRRTVRRERGLLPFRAGRHGRSGGRGH